MTDSAGVTRSYLANEDNFNVMKGLESANLLVPVVGNFSGPKALRAIGTWLRDHNAKVAAYYLSNVEDYLNRDGSWMNFCQNASTLPLDEKSTFIRSGAGYRPPFPPPASLQPTIVASDQLNRVVSQGGGTITLPDGRVMTITTNGSSATSFTFAAMSVAGLGLGPSNHLGLMQTDLAPCAPPKLVPGGPKVGPPYDGPHALPQSARNSSK
jgi:hypothetical protein